MHTVSIKWTGCNGAAAQWSAKQRELLPAAEFIQSAQRFSCQFIYFQECFVDVDTRHQVMFVHGIMNDRDDLFHY